MRVPLLAAVGLAVIATAPADASSFSRSVSDTLPRFAVVRGDTVTVRGSVIENMTVFPVDASLRAMRATVTAQDSGRRVSAQLPSYTLRFLARNPFVIVTDRRTGAASLVQLPASPTVFGGRMFLPAPAFPVLFRDLTTATLVQGPAGSVTMLDTAGIRGQFDITRVDVESRLNGYLMTIRAARKLGTVETWLKPDGWLFITIEGAKADTNAIKQTRLTGAVRRVLVFQSPTSVQLTFRVAPDVEAAEVVQDPASNDLLVTLRTRSELEKQDLARKRQEIADREKTVERNRWKLDVIVIDPGHGGKDPGTIGLSNVYEKTIALGIGLKLGDLIKKHLPGVKVVYTRSNDRFVELYRRTQIANESGGKLFISIHCNALPKKPSPVNGFEIYLLRPGRTDDAVRIAAQENSVIQFEEDKGRYKELTEEEFILVTMAQSAYLKYSETFAEVAVGAMAKGTDLKNGGVKQAGFYVLVGASMPNALVETGYLSNKKDETYLRSTAGQQKIAQALLDGIRSFKTVYERELNEGLGFVEPLRPTFSPLDAMHR